MIVAAIGARIWARGHFGEEAAYMFTPCRMDALAFGALAAAVVRAPDPPALSPMLLKIGGIAIVIAGLVVGRLDRTGASMQYIGYSIIAAGFAVSLLGALDGSRVLEWAPLRRVGLYSYGMYVFGTPLHLFVGLRLVGASPSVGVAIAYLIGLLIATFVCAAISYHLFEQRFLALKAKLAP